MAREACLAGRFYPRDPLELRREVDRLTRSPPVRVPGTALGLLVPHATLAYSGMTAGATWGAVEVPDRVIILSPNHTGIGGRISVARDGPFLTPAGAVELDADLSEALVDRFPEARFDDDAHREEHGVEVHLPYLLARNPAARLVAICMRTMSYSLAEELGAALAEQVRASGGRAVIVASSDLSHREPVQVARRKDRMVLNRLQLLDPKGLYGAAVEHHVSMCGLAGAVAMLVAARALGARSGVLVSYRTSVDCDGDESRVVGYAGLVATSARVCEGLQSLQ
ncbi:MAG TPA: AmmeMemoRadiSam system protein B [Myxococcota bacterium]|nr:AmmeMemoRadiSam system protein B [Myxococcota bacterium]HQK50283.1 AmmeMemoRadiSam system protein B [Myxococcota bacterium]